MASSKILEEAERRRQDRVHVVEQLEKQGKQQAEADRQARNDQKIIPNPPEEARKVLHHCD